MVYLESALLENFIERPVETAPYHAEFDWLRSGALSPIDSLSFIERSPASSSATRKERSPANPREFAGDPRSPAVRALYPERLYQG